MRRLTTLGGAALLTAFGAVLAAVPVYAQSADGRADSKALLNGRTFPASTIACADLSATPTVSPSLHIVTGQVPERRSACAAGEVVVLSAPGASAVSVGQQYAARRVLRSGKAPGALASGLSSVHTAGLG